MDQFVKAMVSRGLLNGYHDKENGMNLSFHRTGYGVSYNRYYRSVYKYTKDVKLLKRDFSYNQCFSYVRTKIMIWDRDDVLFNWKKNVTVREIKEFFNRKCDRLTSLDSKYIRWINMLFEFAKENNIRIPEEYAVKFSESGLDWSNEEEKEK